MTAMTSRDPESSSRDPNTLKAQYLENSMEMLFSDSRLLDSLLRDSTVGCPSDSLASCYVGADIFEIYVSFAIDRSVPEEQYTRYTHYPGYPAPSY